VDMSLVNSPDLGSKLPYDSETKRLGELNAEKKANLALRDKYTRLSGKCPTCDQDIDSDFVNGEIFRLVNDLVVIERDRDGLNDTIAEIKKVNKAIQTKLDAVKEFESLYSHVDRSLPEIKLDALDFETRIQALETEIEEKREKVRCIIAENAKIDKQNTRILVIQEQQDDFKEQLKVLRVEIEEVSKVHNNLEVLKKAFSTNGLLAYKIEYLVKELETIVNEYLAELSDGRFTLTFVVSKDKLNVEITDNGKLVDILSLSSGELARVNTSTLLAIRRLMNSISKSQINVLFLDEVIGVLDDPGREKLVDVLVQETKLNTFIVSHEWSHPLLNKLNITKDNNISKLIKE
jgi:DNA repair exonuclease SbcCD ATPase subunit